MALNVRHALLVTFGFFIGCAVLAKPIHRKLPFDEPAFAIAEKGVTTPASVPLNARLIANRIIHTLDRGDLDEIDYRKQLDLGRKMGRPLPAPHVDLIFELQNTGKEEMHILVGGDASGSLRWQLRGPGAAAVTFRPVIQTDDFKAPSAIKIPPGGSHRWTFKELDCSGPRDTSRVYWTQAGDYLLSAGFTVAVRPPPKGSVPHWYYKDHANVAISSGSVRLTVLDR